MALDADEEILQDFLVEASEILEQLGEQLVELEQNPEDDALLNAVFRGFHTIKGGAGFLNLIPLVEVCHRAEDVFNLLRNGERKVDSALMDVVLPVVDVLHEMFESIRGGEEPRPASPELLRALEELAGGAPVEEQASESSPGEQNAPAAAETAKPETPAGSSADEEFDAMLDALEKESEPDPKQGESDDEITEEEFDALLDQLHGKGGAPGKKGDTTPSGEEKAAGGDDISEEEFEALLDQLYGKGGAPGKVKGAPAVADGETGSAPASKPAQERSGESAPKETKSESKPSVSRLAPKPKQDIPPPETTVRVDTKRLDGIMNMVGELVLVRNRLVNLESELDNEEVAKAVGNLDVVTADLQAAVMKTRMQPIKKVFGRFPRVVRDLARNLKKEINLELQGEETDLDKNLVEALADPLVHLVRNAVDHGIEPPDERERKGKPRAGTVVLSAEQEGDHILLTIEDDGAGMDPEKLRNKAIEKGILDESAAARLDDRECFNLIFMPGFSTKTEISDVSGRGVGMDVVKTSISQLNGSIEIDSVVGEGTRLTIKVPLTLAIIPTLMVVLGKQVFALPLVNVSEIFDLDLNNTNMVDGQRVVMVRDIPLPLFYLSQWLIKGAGEQPNKENPVSAHVVVVHAGTQKVGFVVDQLIGQEEVVIKPLGALLQDVPGLAGATITGDGKISLILDVPSLLRKHAAGQRRVA